MYTVVRASICLIPRHATGWKKSQQSRVGTQGMSQRSNWDSKPAYRDKDQWHPKLAEADHVERSDCISLYSFLYIPVVILQVSSSVRVTFHPELPSIRSTWKPHTLQACGELRGPFIEKCSGHSGVLFRHVELTARNPMSLNFT